MQLIINLPSREQTMDFHRRRWDEVVRDRDLARLGQRIETNAWGQIVMTPPARFIHSRRQSKIASQLEVAMRGYSATECGLITGDGVKVVDVVWLSPERFSDLGDQNVLETSPEICVEILSPSNSDEEIQNKFRLYFDAGAQECWTCDEDGRMSYYEKSLPNDPKPTSTLCPNFPNTITD
ncbi:hypothetical protein Poly51_03810 [Rubripirellula tenax]|uniref:Putative restriction endonuclease domain-containing protein n=1 Tax=Rubripirellula tenax TaxID=2528015 RepID=A0A5C6FJ38_9BACT|nr:Uma2 family endonuclease [Rubripirellula tenax]TWU60107.1 hypothetical protein Poly51_03810 [Rubripirellula tenax]